jgi:hypothetical protein
MTHLALTARRAAAHAATVAVARVKQRRAIQCIQAYTRSSLLRSKRVATAAMHYAARAKHTALQVCNFFQTLSTTC